MSEPWHVRRIDGVIDHFGPGDGGGEEVDMTLAAETGVIPEIAVYASLEVAMQDQEIVTFESDRVNFAALAQLASQKRPEAYAAKLADARAWFAANPVVQLGPVSIAVVDEALYPYLYDECITEVDGPGNPWTCARAIIDASERSDPQDMGTRTRERARRAEQKRIKAALA